MEPAVKTIDETAHTFESLLEFLDKPIRLDSNNYRGAVAAYRADRKRIDRDRADARDLIRWAKTWGVTVDDVRHESTRLTWNISDGWQYCPGQYYPTEVCAAVAAAVSDAIVSKHRHARLAEPGIIPLTGEACANPCKGLLTSIVDYIAACDKRAGRRLARWFR